MYGDTLRTLIEQALSIRKWSLVKLAEETYINRSVFSNTLRAKDPTPISFSLLEKITLALGYAEDYFFIPYINECFIGGKSNKSRLQPFLIRCGELGRIDCLEQVLERLKNENEKRHLEIIFDVAEHLVRIHRKTEALILHRWIVLADENSQSERMIVSHYRVFAFSIGDDEEQNYQALLKFIPMLSGLPNVIKIEALNTVINLNDILSLNHESLPLAEEKIRLCVELFGTEDNPISNPQTSGYTFSIAPVFYYGHAYLMKQHCLFELGDFKAGLEYSKYYADLSWFPELEDSDRVVVERLGMFARANVFHAKIMLGDFKVLEQLPDFLQENPRETLPFVITVLDAANQYNVDVDNFIQKYNFDIQEYISLKDNTYAVNTSKNRYILFLQKLSTYHYNRGRNEEALQAAIQSWELSKTTNNHSHLRMLASLAVMYNTTPAE
ncbi:hypothetical protein B9G55_09570 [Saccharibacillus sp. O16]|nr:hypothetical protein B9G55_09570 [Saccharibacillus sp. O16]